MFSPTFLTVPDNGDRKLTFLLLIHYLIFIGGLASKRGNNPFNIFSFPHQPSLESIFFNV